MKIQRLDEATANRIAAGEVVERPASVVKELCENAVDAGATAVTVEIEAGGLVHIRVTDNGCGMSAEDLPVAFERHATGKIRSGDSLNAIETLGFRGEALSSIAAVSQVEITSRESGAQVGNRLVLHAGKILDQSECGCPEGTSISVDQLFYNTPARLKFAKGPAAEATQVSDVITRLILANPNLSVRFLNNKKLVLQSPGTGLLDAIRAVYGNDVARQCIPISTAQSGAIRYEGFLGAPEISRQTRSVQTLCVNGRPIRNQALSNAVQKGYGERLMIGRFPFFVLHLHIPFAAVDVNVHPQKMQVRFTNEEELSAQLCALVAQTWEAYRRSQMGLQTPHETSQPAKQDRAGDACETIEAGGQAPHEPEEAMAAGAPVQTDSAEKEGAAPLTGGANAPDLQPASYTAASTDDGAQPLRGRTLRERIAWMQQHYPPLSTEDDQMHEGVTGMDFPEPVNDRNAETQVQETEPEQEQLSFQTERGALGESPIVIGQLFETYILVQSGESLYIIDQHAAHERLTYDAYRQQIANRQVISQELLTTEIIPLTFAEMQAFGSLQELFCSLGFICEPFGPQEIAVRAVPVLMQQVPVVQLFHDILDQSSMGQTVTSFELQRERIIRSACRHSIKAGDRLSQVELQTLVQKLQENEQLTCPHGRPVALKVLRRDLEKGFRRVL